MDALLHAKLQLVSIELQQKTGYNLQCSISLVKGMQFYDEIKLKIDKDKTFYTYENKNKIIDFSYNARLKTKYDVFFHLKLTDLQTQQQLGDIKISTLKLINFFQNNPSGVLQQTGIFFQGAQFKYKIYQPQIIRAQSNNTIGFKNTQSNDLIGQFFSTGQNQGLNPIMARSRIRKSSMSINPSISSIHLNPNSNHNIASSSIKLDGSKGPNVLVQSISVNALKTDSIILEKQEHQNQKENQNQIQKLAQLLKISKYNQQHSEQFLKNIERFTDEGFIQTKEKHAFSSNKPHHHHHGLSKKLKAVIILLILGFIILVVQSLSDKSERKKPSKKSKISSVKKSKLNHM